MRHSYPNDADDARARLAYTTAAEFIYRIDAFLERQDRDCHPAPLGEWDSMPVDAVRTVRQCAQAALEMLEWLQRNWHSDSSSADLQWSGWNLGASTPDAAQIMAETAQVLRGELSCTTFDDAFARGSKAHLMHLLANELFASFEALTQDVLRRANAFVDTSDVSLLLAYVDAAMGMVYELCEVSWPKGTPIPAHAVIQMRDHVISNRLECDGPEAVQPIRDVYEAFLAAVVEAAT